MSATLDIAVGDFGNPRWDQAPFRALVRQALERRATLALDAAADRFRLSVAAEPEPASAPLVLSGRWRSPLHAEADRPDARLLLPVLFYVSGLRLPSARLQTLGFSYRPVGDFFMRNLFLALCGGAPVALGATALPARGPAVQALQLHYCSILKWAFPEPAFTDRPLNEIADLLVAAGHCRLGRFESALLNHGLATARAGTATAADDAPAARAGRLAATRARIMAHFG